jgi:hypothetical protein
MKKAILIAAMVLGASVSHAKTVCSISAGNPTQDMVFDRGLFNAEITAPNYVLVRKDLSSAQEVQLSQFDSYAKWKAVNGDTLVTFSQQENGEYGITVGVIDISKAKTNMLPLEAMAIGPVTDKQFLNLILPKKNLSLICLQQ